jgi:DNA-binding MarR family transcriptional regulator
MTDARSPLAATLTIEIDSVAMQSRPRVIDAIVDLFREGMEGAQRHFGHEFGKQDMPFDLSMAQFRTLMALSQGEPATISQLSQRMNVGLPAASHLVDRLVQLGLVDRHEDPADRRRALVRLDANGRDLVQRLTLGPLTLMRQTLALMADDDLAALLDGMKAMVEAQHRLIAQPAPPASEAAPSA